MREYNTIKHTHSQGKTQLLRHLDGIVALIPYKALREWISILKKYILAATHISVKKFALINDTCVS